MKNKIIVLIITLILICVAIFALFFNKDDKDSGKISLDELFDEKEGDVNKDKDEDKSEAESNKSDSDEVEDEKVNSNNEESDEGTAGNKVEDEKLYYGDTKDADGNEIEAYKTKSGISINGNAAEIAKQLGFTLRDYSYYMELTPDDLTSYKKAYDVLRGINLYLAADDLWYTDRAEMAEVYNELRAKYLELKYEGAATNNYDAIKFELNGNKPQKENKLDDYSYLMGANALPTVFFSPKELAKDKSKFFEEQADIKKISSGELDKAWEVFTEKSAEYQKTLNETQKEDLNKINEVVNAYNEAYKAMDYNDFAKILNKEYRESEGPKKMSEIKDKLYMTQINFVINYIDEKTGLAVGYAFNTTANLTKLETLNEADYGEAFYYSIDRVSFRENIKGEWELYYQFETKFYD